MMDEENTKMRNEIMRNIKMHQMKERNLPNFIRKKREEMLARVNKSICLTYNREPNPTTQLFSQVMTEYSQVWLLQQ